LDLLSILALDDPHGDGLGLSELARRMSLPANSVHNLLKTMVVCGYVGQRPDSKYIPGPCCRQIARMGELRSGRLKEAVLPVMHKLSDLLGEGLNFAVMVRGRRLVVADVDVSGPVRVDRRTAERHSIYRLATMRVLLACSADQEVAEAIANYGWPGVDWGGIDDSESLSRDLADVRRLGHVSLTPNVADVAAFACGVFDAGGQFVGALGCYAPMYRCGAGQQERIVAELKLAAQRIAPGL